MNPYPTKAPEHATAFNFWDVLHGPSFGCYQHYTKHVSTSKPTLILSHSNITNLVVKTCEDRLPDLLLEVSTRPRTGHRIFTTIECQSLGTGSFSWRISFICRLVSLVTSYLNELESFGSQLEEPHFLPQDNSFEVAQLRFFSFTLNLCKSDREIYRCVKCSELFSINIYIIYNLKKIY